MATMPRTETIYRHASSVLALLAAGLLAVVHMSQERWKVNSVPGFQ
jgi:hypothetical protein